MNTHGSLLQCFIPAKAHHFLTDHTAETHNSLPASPTSNSKPTSYCWPIFWAKRIMERQHSIKLLKQSAQASMFRTNPTNSAMETLPLVAATSSKSDKHCWACRQRSTYGSAAKGWDCALHIARGTLNWRRWICSARSTSKPTCVSAPQNVGRGSRTSKHAVQDTYVIFW